MNSAERHAPAAFQHLPTSDSKHQKHGSTQDVSEENQQKTHTELLKPRVSVSSNNMGQYGVFDIIVLYFFPANSFGRVA